MIDDRFQLIYQVIMYEKIKKMKLVVLMLLLNVCQGCHYSCASCSTEDYYTCLVCNSNRGNNSNHPIYGMCYCSNTLDEGPTGFCTGNENHQNRTLIIAFIVLSLVLALFTAIVKRNRYFLIKIFQDIQEMSLIGLINLYFPLQLDSLLTSFYNFNLSSYTFQTLFLNILFTVEPDSSVNIIDGQNVYGKYKLLHKTGNFLSNQFTWILIAAVVFLIAIIIKIIRNYLNNKKQKKIIKKIHLQITNQSMYEMYKQKQKTVNKESNKLIVMNILNNAFWYNILIYFFYFSLIQININIFIQIANLTFSSSLASAGAFMSALFLSVQVVLLILLYIKVEQEMIKPQWMRDYSFAACFHLIRTNYKSLSKYFWFVSCAKRIFLAGAVTLFYHTPVTSIAAVAVIHGVYLFTAIYCEPFDKRHIRMHFYVVEGLKMFIYLALINFTNKYANFVQLIALTQILYGLLITLFATNFCWVLLALWFEKDVCCHNLNICSQEGNVTGYRTQEKLFIYRKESSYSQLQI